MDAMNYLRRLHPQQPHKSVILSEGREATAVEGPAVSPPPHGTVILEDFQLHNQSVIQKERKRRKDPCDLPVSITAKSLSQKSSRRISHSRGCPILRAAFARRVGFTNLTLLLILTALAHAQSAEQVDRGQLTINNGSYNYTIRRLPISSFPELPVPIRDALDHRRCVVPQTYDARRPDNVISGSFLGEGTTAWAILCSNASTTTLLVFAADSPTPTELGSHSDVDVLTQHTGSKTLGYSWAIGAATPVEVSRVSKVEADQIDHEGIKDEIIDQSSVLHFHSKGKWMVDNYY